MTLPDKEFTINVLIEVLRKTALDSNAQHPEDIVASIIPALDGAAVAIMETWRDQTGAIGKDL